MRLFVTGGAGFIGSHYVRTPARRRLPGVRGRRGHRLRQADLRRQPGQPRAGRRLARASVRPGDICDPAALDAAAARARRGRQLRRRDARRPVDHRRGRLRRSPTSLGAQTLLRRRAARRGERVVHVSTDEVYGTIHAGSWTEDHLLRAELAVLGGQGGSRPAGPRVRPDLRAARRRSPAARNNYGPYQFPEKVIPLFVTNLIDGRQVPLYGDGLNVRDWLHVDDHCRGIQLVLEQGAAGRGLQHRRRRRADQQGAHRPAAARPPGAAGTRVEHVDRPQGPRPALLGRPRQDRRDWATARGTPSRTGWPRPCGWYRDNRAWWEPLKARGVSAGWSPVPAASSAPTCWPARRGRPRGRRPDPGRAGRHRPGRDREGGRSTVPAGRRASTRPRTRRWTRPRADEATARAVERRRRRRTWPGSARCTTPAWCRSPPTTSSPATRPPRTR